MITIDTRIFNDECNDGESVAMPIVKFEKIQPLHDPAVSSKETGCAGGLSVLGYAYVEPNNDGYLIRTLVITDPKYGLFVILGGSCYKIPENIRQFFASHSSNA